MIYVHAKFHIYNGHQTERQMGSFTWPVSFIVHSTGLQFHQGFTFSLYMLSHSIF
jgi:hypothetical protein